jgi:TPR repeat protein
MGAAFLVFRRAAEAGNAPAQLELASFYDPLTPPKARLHARRRARRRLVRTGGTCRLGRGAAQARPAAGQGRRRAGGRSGEGESWLQQAAAQNDADAKKALDALPK